MDQSSTATRIVVALCVTVTAGLALLCYYFNKEMKRKNGQLKSEEHVSSKEREVLAEKPSLKERACSEAFGDMLTSAQAFKPNDSVAAVSTPTETSHSSAISSVRMEKATRSAKMMEQMLPPRQDLSQKSVVPTHDMNSISSTGGSSSASTTLSPAITKPPAKLGPSDDMLFAPETKPLVEPIAVEKLESKSVISGDTAKPLPVDDIPSPKEIIPIDSYCDCGQDSINAMGISGELNENNKVELLPTIVKPVSFDPYSPEDLTQVEGSSDELSQNSLGLNPAPENHRIIVPFLPILNAITYTSKHAQLLQELVQNYEFFESQALEGP